jgi:hypothetical protein
MPETPSEFNNDQSFEPAEQEARKQQFQKLAEQHRLLEDEMENLIAEEETLIGKNSEDETDFVRLQEINRREIEIVEEEKGIVEAMAQLWGRLDNRQA